MSTMGTNTVLGTAAMTPLSTSHSDSRGTPEARSATDMASPQNIASPQDGSAQAQGTDVGPTPGKLISCDTFC